MMRTCSLTGRLLLVGLCLLALATVAAAPAQAKPWKGAEMITQQSFRYGAFEARLRAARGSGMITPFFLYKDRSEIVGQEWEEMDFEIFGKDGTFQTQIMTPGRNGAQRTDHARHHSLPTAAWDDYHTYRMEWTPTQLSFFMDGQLIRRETDPLEFAKLLDPSRTEAMRLRVSLWAGNSGWSGIFDQSMVPGAMFVNWIQVYSFTPGTGPGGSDFTLLWRDDLGAANSQRWSWANWTFDAAISDYTPRNSASRNGYLVQVLTADTATGQFPAPPADSACAPVSTVYQAETMSHTTGGAITGGWNLWSNGSLSTSHTFRGGSTRLRVRAAGQAAAGVWPHMVVRVGGQAIGDVAVNSTTFAPYPFITNVAAAGAQTVSIAFDNDLLANGQDRNLLVDAVTIDECPGATGFPP